MLYVGCGKKIVEFGEVLGQASYKPELLRRRPHGSHWERVTLVGEMTFAASSRFGWFSTCNIDRDVSFSNMELFGVCLSYFHIN